MLLLLLLDAAPPPVPELLLVEVVDDDVAVVDNDVEVADDEVEDVPEEDEAVEVAKVEAVEPPVEDVAAVGLLPPEPVVKAKPEPEARPPVWRLHAIGTRAASASIASTRGIVIRAIRPRTTPAIKGAVCMRRVGKGRCVCAEVPPSLTSTSVFAATCGTPGVSPRTGAAGVSPRRPRQPLTPWSQRSRAGLRSPG